MQWKQWAIQFRFPRMFCKLGGWAGPAFLLSLLSSFTGILRGLREMQLVPDSFWDFYWHHCFRHFFEFWRICSQKYHNFGFGPFFGGKKMWMMVQSVHQFCSLPKELSPPHDVTPVTALGSLCLSPLCQPVCQPHLMQLTRTTKAESTGRHLPWRGDCSHRTMKNWWWHSGSLRYALLRRYLFKESPISCWNPTQDHK